MPRAPRGTFLQQWYRLPEGFQTFQLLQKFAQLRREKAPHGRSNGFFYRRSRLPFAPDVCLITFQTLKPSTSAQLRQGKGTPTSPTRATPACKTPNFAGKPLLLGRSSLPFASLQTLKTLKMPRRPCAFIETLHTLDTSAQLRREKVPQQAQHAPLPHAKRPTSQASLCC